MVYSRGLFKKVRPSEITLRELMTSGTLHLTMKEDSVSRFGLMIAYLAPGFTVLLAASHSSPLIASWLSAATVDAQTVGGFMLATIGSIACGVTVSAVRWATIDRIHHTTGIHPPSWDFGQLRSNTSEYRMLIEMHYVYYKFHANMFVALAVSYLSLRMNGVLSHGWSGADVGFMLVEVVLFAGSRDTLRKYYARTSQLFSEPALCDSDSAS